MRDPTQTRRRILEEAYRLFVEHGYHGTSLSRLMEATGLSKGAIYHHFSSKEAIFVAVLAWKVEELLEALRTVDAPQPHRRAEERFRVLAHRFFTHRQDIHLFAIHAQNLPSRLLKEIIRTLKPLFDELLNLLSEPLTRLYPAREARMYAIFAMGALRFSFMPHVAHELPTHFETYWKIYRKFVDGILSPVRTPGGWS